jgi:siroheme synthase-like protein
MPTPVLYPLFLKLDGRRCVVVGGGPIAAQKARELVASGARVRVISPELDEQAWSEMREAIEWIPRPFENGDCEGAIIVISATADDAVDAAVVADGHRFQALVNTVDVIHRCDFYAGSVVRRGPITVAISSSGASPSVAVTIRKSIERLLPEALPLVVETLGRRRPELLAAHPDFSARAIKLNRAIAQAFEKLSALSDVSSTSVDAWIERLIHCDNDCEGACCALELLHAGAAGAEAP